MTRPLIKGRPVDGQTRCVHYASPLDIVALKFACCGDWFPCFYCHEETAGHAPRRWAVSQRSEVAILCGACGTGLTISQYLDSGSFCPRCGAGFNPKCHSHNHLYFEMTGDGK